MTPNPLVKVLHTRSDHGDHGGWQRISDRLTADHRALPVP